MTNPKTDPNYSALISSINQEFEKKSLLDALRFCQSEISDEVVRFKKLEGALASESKDVQLLNSVSLKNIVATLKGNKDIELKLEMSEKLAAEIKLQASEEILKELRDEERKLKLAIYSVGTDSEERSKFKGAKKVALTEEQSNLIKKIANNQSGLNLIQKTIRHVTQAETSMQKVKDSLNQIKSPVPHIDNFVQLNLAEHSAKSALIGIRMVNKGLEKLNLPQINPKNLDNLTTLNKFVDLTNSLFNNNYNSEELAKAYRTALQDWLKVSNLLSERKKQLEILIWPYEAENENLKQKWELLKLSN